MGGGVSNLQVQMWNYGISTIEQNDKEKQKILNENAL